MKLVFLSLYSVAIFNSSGYSDENLAEKMPLLYKT